MAGRILLAATVLAAAGAVHGAEFYRWTDESGQVHYGSSPPAAGAEKIEIQDEPVDAGATPDRSRLRSELLEAFEQKREEKKAAREKAAREKAERQRRCALAKDRLRTYERSSRVYLLDRDGNRVYLPDGAREDALRRSREAIAKWCR